MERKEVSEYVEEQNLQGITFDEIIENVISFYDYQRELAVGVVMDILMDLEKKEFFS